MAVIAAAYWCSGCVRQVYVMGVSAYMKERVLLLRYGKQIPGWCSKTIKKAQKGIEKVYNSFDNIDFTDRNNKTILKIVLINALILTVITVLWFYGIVAVVIYSIILFFILRKYFNDLKDKYALLLNATNQMAEGNLNVEVTDDLGVFNPFKKELEKIQDGYQKAVDKEVKSQKMKTELITNMSHDLKTPLTAIITYVDLLKLEKDEEKRKEYIQILEKKSLRLKVLIEDLFEISKATSQTVTLKNTVCLLTVQFTDQLFLRPGTAKTQFCFVESAVQFQLYLFKQIYHVHIHLVERYRLAGCLTDLKQILDQYLQAQRFPNMPCTEPEYIRRYAGKTRKL